MATVQLSICEHTFCGDYKRRSGALTETFGSSHSASPASVVPEGKDYLPLSPAQKVQGEEVSFTGRPWGAALILSAGFRRGQYVP